MEILIGIVWVAYGLFTVYQADAQDEPILTVVIIAFSPVVLVVRGLIGIFGKDIF